METNQDAAGGAIGKGLKNPSPWPQSLVPWADSISGLFQITDSFPVSAWNSIASIPASQWFHFRAPLHQSNHYAVLEIHVCSDYH